MARRHKVSRVSVREAYKSLEELGVVTARRGADGGAFVAVPGHAAIQNSLGLMFRLGRASSEEVGEALMIQPIIAQLAARHARPDDIRRLKRVLGREAAGVSSGVRRATGSWEFHRAIARSARNLPLVALFDSLSAIARQLSSHADLSAPVPAHTCRVHRLIANAIERRDEDAAYRLMQQHLDSGCYPIAVPSRQRVRAA